MKCAFFDRDGVINHDQNYVYKIEDFVFMDGIFELLDYLKHKNYLLLVITNQSGIARGFYQSSDVERVHSFMQGQLCQRLGFGFDKIYFCPHLHDCNCRKPNTGMVEQAMRDFAIDLDSSFLIGDNLTDMQCAQNAHINYKFLLDCEGRFSDEHLVFSNCKKCENLAQVQRMLKTM